MSIGLSRCSKLEPAAFPIEGGVLDYCAGAALTAMSVNRKIYNKLARCPHRRPKIAIRLCTAACTSSARSPALCAAPFTVKEIIIYLALENGFVRG
ncbi:hypothetical protein EVAR_76451_1 [Eumeta japonica]|uniref:Uncharacterized protein n=1 Tax=Eumeta variegata TaxID=151549 RepID=A0A4C1TBF4_EUMVA|nr:hypothetical protein EVAR_76451_1 [Eumeta japonica]